jgi:hypothetical protein
MTELFAPSNSQSISVFYRLILPMVFILIGVAVLWFGVAEFLKAKEAANWKSVDGVILQSEVKSDIRETRENNRTRKYRVFWAEIKFRYQIEGKELTGNRIRFGEFESDSPESAEVDVMKFPVGKTVAIFFNPENPSESVLETEMQGGVFLLIGLGALFIGAGAAAFIWLNR